MSRLGINSITINRCLYFNQLLVYSNIESDSVLKFAVSNIKVKAAALFSLTAKISENNHNLNFAVNKFLLDEFEKKAACVLELQILKAADFCTEISLPHFYLQNCISLLNGLEKNDRENICRIAFHFANDAMLSFVCTHYNPVHVSFVCIILGMSFWYLEDKRRKMPFIYKEDLAGKLNIFKEMLIHDLIYLILLNYDKTGKKVDANKLMKFDILSLCLKQKYR